MNMQNFLFGAAYYAEYMPYPRTPQDMRLMKEAGMNVIRIAESTWSTWEPQDGTFDFSQLLDMLEAAETEGLQVIVGTPTYAVPTWLAKKYPEILADGPAGRERYGHRQLFDLNNPDYRRYAERIIRKMMEVCAGKKCIIGYQLDNETHTAGDASCANQQQFVAQLRKKYPDIRDFNREFGLDYWSNRVNNWNDFPDIRGTINGSLSAAYKRYLRETVTEFLTWQAGIVREYMSPEQFITHNFDFSWEECSVGIQPLVNQKDAAACMDIPGCDIYHLMQDDLDGATIAFGGAVGRSLKKGNYLVLETEAQGRVGWLPYPGQLRLSAYSHLANGASGVMYWNWHSIHNAIESYWKGILSHDLTPHEIYFELADFRKKMIPLEPEIRNLKKENRTAILVDNQSLVGLDEFPISKELSYNHLLRRLTDACHRINLEYDLVYPDDDFSSYDLVLAPHLYSAGETLIRKLRAYVSQGGHLFMSCRSTFSDEELKIWPDAQPHGLTEVFGMTYDRFTVPKNVQIRFRTAAPYVSAKIDGSSDCSDKETPLQEGEAFPVEGWMELLRPAAAEIWGSYVHPVWKSPAVTFNRFGQGTAVYLGCCLDIPGLEALLRKTAASAGLKLPKVQFPIIRKTGRNEAGKEIVYYFNFSSEEVCFSPEEAGTILLAGDSRGNALAGRPGKAVMPVEKHSTIQKGETVRLAPWDLMIIALL